MTLKFWDDQHVWTQTTFDNRTIDTIMIGTHDPVFDLVEDCVPWRCFTVRWQDGCALSVEAEEVEALPVHIMYAMSCLGGTPGQLEQPYGTELATRIQADILQMMDHKRPDKRMVVFEHPDGSLQLGALNMLRDAK